MGFVGASPARFVSRRFATLFLFLLIGFSLAMLLIGAPGAWAATCTDCHVDPGIINHPDGYNCVLCHPYGTDPLNASPSDDHYYLQPNSECLDCHPDPNWDQHWSPVNFTYGKIYVDGIAQSGATYTCEDCHNSSRPDVPDHTTAHNTTVPASCQGSGCHANETNLVPIHATGGCAGCHESADPLVVAAIAANNTACSACHPTPHGPPLHDTTVPAGCQGTGCHAAATNLLPVHSALACADCHDSADFLVSTAIATGNTACSACHPTPHAAPLHDTTVPAGCQGTGCHAAATNLLPVHTALTCDDCHGSSDPLVSGAIAIGNTACSACHPTPHAAPLHDTTVPAGCQGTGCHAAATNLLPVHTALTCDDCHGSGDPLVSGAIATGNTACAACHPTPHGPPLHDTVVPPASCQAVGCHPGTNLLPIHSALVCADCHSSSDTTVTDAITAGDKRCETCHPDADHSALHVTAEPPASCQAVGCHPGTNLLPIHSGLACADCHSSSDTTVTDAITAGDKRCETCHPDADHSALHVTAEPPASCQAVGCHPGTNLLPIHSALVCADCHASSDTTVTDAITAGDKRCETCHPDADHGDAMVAAHAGVWESQCANQCHGSDLVAAHNGDCAGCHEGPVPLDGATCFTCHPDYHSKATITPASAPWSLALIAALGLGAVLVVRLKSPSS